MGRYYEKKVLIEALQKKALELRRIPTPEDMIEPPIQAYLSFFKKWERAVKTANIQTLLSADSPQQPEISPTPCAKKTPATIIKKTDEPVETSTLQTRRRYSKNIIAQMLLDEFKRLGKKPTRKEIDANKALPTVATCLSYFGTTRIGDIWEEILDQI